MNTNKKLNMTMLCDFYELTMGNGYFKAGYKDRITHFDLFFRNVPDKGGYAIAAGLDSAIMDPCNMDMIGTICACEALTMKDKGGRKYNRAYRQGRFGVKK